MSNVSTVADAVLGQLSPPEFSAGRKIRAYLFDLDGVLVDSHEFQITALLRAITSIASKKGVRYSLSETVAREKLKDILVGGTEVTAVRAFHTQFPAFSEHAREIFACAWADYYSDIVIRRDAFILHSSVRLLKLLLDLEVPVCIVSSSKRSDIERYCRIIGLDEVLQRGWYIGFEDVSAAKPSPEPYLLAARLLGVQPESCCVLEDSEIGVVAGKQAGMYVVGLSAATGLTSDSLTQAGADEIVSNLTLAQVCKDAAFGAPHETVQCDNGLSLSVHEAQSLSAEALHSLGKSTYTVYEKMFNGRSLEQWMSRLEDQRDLRTRIGIFKESSTGCLIGYAIMKLREVHYENEQRLVCLVSAGLDSSRRGGGDVVKFYQREFRRICLAYPNHDIHMFDNFLGYAGYSIALRVFHELVPSARKPEPSEDERRYMQHLANTVGYVHAGTTDPLVYRSSSYLQMSPETASMLRANSDVNCQYFLSRTKLEQGHGLITLGTVSYENLRPIMKLKQQAMQIKTTSVESTGAVNTVKSETHQSKDESIVRQVGKQTVN